MIRKHFKNNSPNSWKANILRLCGAILAVDIIILVTKFSVSNNLSSWSDTTEINSLIAVHLILAISHFCYLSINRYPGDRPRFLAIPILIFISLTFYAMILFFRVDYSRSVLGSGLIGMCFWYLGSSIIMRKYVKVKLGLIPLGRTNELRSIPSIEFIDLKDYTGDPTVMDGIIIDSQAKLDDDWQSLLIHSQLNGTVIYDFESAKEMLTGRVTSIKGKSTGIPLLVTNHAYITIRSIADKILALIASPFAIIIVTIAAIAIKIDDGGPILFTQVRTGYKTKHFTVYKIRTMVNSNEDTLSPEDAHINSQNKRITRVGRFLRKSRIDEIPQILNILLGQMAWIGPRPNTIELSDHYRSKFDEYDLRYAVPPGISGWAQVNFGHVCTVDEEIKKVSFDLYYVKNISLSLDLLIAYKTIRVILTGAGAR